MTTATFTLPMDTPIGLLVLEGDEDALVGIRLPNKSGPDARSGADAPPVLKETVTQLEEYFARVRTTFSIPLKLDGTEFQKQVWAALSRIPYGETVSYGELASTLGRPKAARAVGQANGRNPVPILVPCHRVLASDGIGGYGGGLAVKRALLAVEGIAS